MTRYILIDNNSGVIWADVIASDPAQAALRADMIHGEICERDYVVHAAGHVTHSVGYDVYLPPPHFPTYPELCVDAADIARVIAECAPVAFIECRETAETQAAIEAATRAATYPPSVAVQAAAAAVMATFAAWGAADGDWPEPQRTHIRDLRAALATLGKGA